MKTRVFGIAAVLAAVGAGFCCLGPVILAFMGVSAMASLTTLRDVVPYRNVFLSVTLIALGLAYGSVLARRGRASRVEWAILGSSTFAVIVVVAYTISVEGVPRLW
jgi:MerT mercuric transport protein